MSFIEIEDPVERERIVQDYKRLKREIREKYENKKSFSTDQALNLAKRYAPIVKSQKKMTEDIVKELKMSNQREHNEHIKSEDEDENDDHNSGSLAEEYRRRYALRDQDIDTEFGIKFLENGQAVIGNTPITIQGDDIVIGGEVYDGTEGLWGLLTEKRKENLMQVPYSEDDWANYFGILKKTNALRQNFDPNSTHPRSSNSWKWKNILGTLWKKLKKDDNSSDEEE